MKTIAYFIESKIRRSEVEALMRFEPGGAPHPQLGPCEGCLSGPGGELVFHEHGLILSDGSVAPYASMSRVALLDMVTIEISFEDGTASRIGGSDVGTEIVYATLRWIGNAILHKRLAD